MPILDIQVNIAKLQEQAKVLSITVDKMDKKIDQLLVSHLALKWKIMGASMMFSILSALVVEFYRGRS